MKITDSREQAITLGTNNKKNFSVSLNNSKFFRVMSDTLYSDKIGSIIRELACNAIDAHRSSKNLERPFQVFLPCERNPKFCIRDFGTGLSPEQIETVYTCYFESTKDGNNDDIGGFGLGAKTPFSYTDSFVVRSYFNGKLYTYTISFSGDTPEYNLQTVENTNQENGLEVFFDVAPEDFAEFHQKAFATFIWLDHVPDVWTGSELSNGFFCTQDVMNYRESITEYLDKHSISDENVFITGSMIRNPFEGNTKIKRVNVLQGGVLYPVEDTISEKVKELSSTMGYHDSIIIKCNIGDVALTPSRESIEANKESIANIEKKIDKMIVKSHTITRDLIIKSDLSKFQISNKILNLLTSSNLAVASGVAEDKKEELMQDYYLKSVSNIDNDKSATLNALFKERFDETLSDYTKTHSKYSDFGNLFSDDKFSAYTTKSYWKNPRKVDFEKSTFSGKMVSKIWFLGRDDFRCKTFDLMDEMGVDTNGDLVFVFDTFKSKIKDSQFATKHDYIDAMINKFIDFLEADKEDFKICFESDLASKSNIETKTYASNDYSVYYSLLEASVNDDGSLSLQNTNSPETFNEGTYAYVIKDGRTNCLISAKDGSTTVSFTRESVTKFATYAKIMMNVDINGLIMVTKKELKGLEKINEKTNFVSLEELLRNNKKECKKNAIEKIGKINNYIELINFKEFLVHLIGNECKKHFKLACKVFRYLGTNDVVQSFDSLMIKHGDAIWNDHIEGFKNDIGYNPKSVIHTQRNYSQVFNSYNVLESLRTIQHIGFNDRALANLVFSVSFVNDILDCGEAAELFESAPSCESFVNKDTIKQYPLLERFRNINALVCNDTLSDISEYIEYKLEKSKKIEMASV